MLTHEEHMARFSALVEAQGAQADGRAVLLDNLSMLVDDVLQAYSRFDSSSLEHPREWYVVGVLMYAQGLVSRKVLPVELISLGTLIRRACLLGGDATLEGILALEGYYTPGLFEEGSPDIERIAAVLYDYLAAAYGRRAHDDN